MTKEILMVLVKWPTKARDLTVGKTYTILPNGTFLDDCGEVRCHLTGDWKKLETLLPPKEPERAARFNKGKVPLSYMLEADVAMKGMCEVFGFGAIKYERGDWKKGLVVLETIDSMLRHLMAYANGEIFDLDENGNTGPNHSGLPHIDHITCNAVFLATFGKRTEDEDEGISLEDLENLQNHFEED